MADPQSSPPNIPAELTDAERLTQALREKSGLPPEQAEKIAQVLSGWLADKAASRDEVMQIDATVARQRTRTELLMATFIVGAVAALAGLIKYLR